MLNKYYKLCNGGDSEWAEINARQNFTAESSSAFQLTREPKF